MVRKSGRPGKENHGDQLHEKEVINEGLPRRSLAEGGRSITRRRNRANDQQYLAFFLTSSLVTAIDSLSSSPLLGREWSGWESRHGRCSREVAVERCGDAAEIHREVRVTLYYFNSPLITGLSAVLYRRRITSFQSDETTNRFPSLSLNMA